MITFYLLFAKGPPATDNIFLLKTKPNILHYVTVYLKLINTQLHPERY